MAEKGWAAIPIQRRALCHENKIKQEILVIPRRQVTMEDQDISFTFLFHVKAVPF